MNIFILDESPDVAARMLCDKHIPKMLLESAQLLCTLARLYTDAKTCNKAGLYKLSYMKHPCQLWLHESPSNWDWLYEHAVRIACEYGERYHKFHKSTEIIHTAVRVLKKTSAYLYHTKSIHWTAHTPFVQCMPEQYLIPGNPVAAYRRYYAAEKSYFAKWERGTPQPQWFTQLTSPTV